MTTIKCEECGKELSNKAKICPNCGIKIRKKTDLTFIKSNFVLIVFLIFFLTMICIFLFQKKLNGVYVNEKSFAENWGTISSSGIETTTYTFHKDGTCFEREHKKGTKISTHALKGTTTTTPIEEDYEAECTYKINSSGSILTITYHDHYEDAVRRYDSCLESGYFELSQEDQIYHVCNSVHPTRPTLDDYTDEYVTKIYKDHIYIDGEKYLKKD